MTEDQLTPWYPIDVTPKREGVYEVKQGGYSYCDTRHWGLLGVTPDDAVVAYSMFGTVPQAVYQWRGLVECPQPDLFASN